MTQGQRRGNPEVRRMRYSGLSWLSLYSSGYLLFHPTVAAMPPNASRVGTINSTGVEPLDACRDYATGERSDVAWTLDDCTEVWTQFVDTIPLELQQRMGLVDIWRGTATELRRQETPCLAAGEPTGDGIGSSTIRLLGSWIFAEEMGCDWVTPDWEKQHVFEGNGTEAIWYCHFVETLTERELDNSYEELQKARCTVVNWLAYFQFGASSVRLPTEGRSKIIRVSGFWISECVRSRSTCKYIRSQGSTETVFLETTLPPPPPPLPKEYVSKSLIRFSP